MATPCLSSIDNRVHAAVESPALVQLLARRGDFHAFLRARVGGAAADDLLQTAYLRLLERPVTLRDDRALVGWFYRVLRNAAIDHVRRSVRHDRLSRVLALQTPTTMQPDDTVESEQQAAETRQAIARLPAPQREAIEVVYLDGKSIGDLAQQRGITKNSATVRLHRARLALRDVLTAPMRERRACLAA